MAFVPHGVVQTARSQPCTNMHFDLPNSCEINQEQNIRILTIYEYIFIHAFEPVYQKRRLVYHRQLIRMLLQYFDHSSLLLTG